MINIHLFSLLFYFLDSLSIYAQNALQFHMIEYIFSVEYPEVTYMNPLLLLALLHLRNQKKTPSFRKLSLSAPSFDAFKLDAFNIETLLDQLQGAVNALDKVNRLNRIMREPKALSAPASVHELPAPLGAIDQLAPLMQIAREVDIKSLMQNIGPIMEMFGNSQEK